LARVLRAGSAALGPIRSEDLDLVLEGRATKVVDEPTLRLVGEVYIEK
jgi:hypothetical protein